VTRKTRLTRQQSQILQLLEEAGSERVDVVANTLRSDVPTTEPQSFLDDLEDDLRLLLAWGYVELGRITVAEGHARWAAITDSGLRDRLLRLKDRLRVTDRDACFTWPDPAIELSLTDRGREVLSR
jgi:predicted DNA binding protein